MTTDLPYIHPDKSVGTWRAIDLKSILDGDYKPPRPTVGARGDGRRLFYAGRLNSVFAKVGAGKTWYSLLAVKHEMTKAKNPRAVTYIDFEDTPDGVVSRLLGMGVTPNVIRDKFTYISPSDALNDHALEYVRNQCVGSSLCVVDGITSALELAGAGDNGTEYKRWVRTHIQPVMHRGLAIVLVDHESKEAPEEKRYPIDAQYKLGLVSGAAYKLWGVQEMGTGLRGYSRIWLAKDRPGQLGQHGIAAPEGTCATQMRLMGTLTVDATDEHEGDAEIHVTFDEPQTDEWATRYRAKDGTFKTPGQMKQDRDVVNKQAIRDALTGVNGQRLEKSKDATARDSKGNKKARLALIQAMVRDGELIERSAGRNTYVSLPDTSEIID